MENLIQEQSVLADSEPLALGCEILETENLVLRPPHIDDLEDLVKYANNFSIAGNLGRMPYPYYASDALDFITKARNTEKEGHVFAITHKENGHFMGMCGIHPAGDRQELTYVGYWLGEPFWGKGYATEAARALVDIFFKATAHDRMMISAIQNNAASTRVIEKCGGKLWKAGSLWSQANSSLMPVYHYLVTRETWLETRED